MKKKLLLFFINIFIFSLFSYSQSIKKLPVKVLTNIQLPTVEEIEERFPHKWNRIAKKETAPVVTENGESKYNNC